MSLTANNHKWGKKGRHYINTFLFIYIFSAFHLFCLIFVLFYSFILHSLYGRCNFKHNQQCVKKYYFYYIKTHTHIKFYAFFWCNEKSQCSSFLIINAFFCIKNKRQMSAFIKAFLNFHIKIICVLK